MKDMIIVHCSATTPKMDIGAKEIRRWHVEDNGWLDIGYNYVIRHNGAVELGRDLDGDGDASEETGAHAMGFNKRSIGICLVGGLDSNGGPDSNYTFSQLDALYTLVSKLSTEHNIDKVVGHRDLTDAKTCPCFDVQALLSEVL